MLSWFSYFLPPYMKRFLLLSCIYLTIHITSLKSIQFKTRMKCLKFMGHPGFWKFLPKKIVNSNKEIKPILTISMPSRWSEFDADRLTKKNKPSQIMNKIDTANISRREYLRAEEEIDEDKIERNCLLDLKRNINKKV